MELGGYGFEKSELLKLAEQIYEYNNSKQKLELELSSEEFHRSYIPKRENMTGTRIMANLPLVIIFLIGIFTFIASTIYCIMADEKTVYDAFAMLGSGLFVVYIAGVGRTMLKEELQMIVMFAYSNNPDKAMRFANKHGISTFQYDRIRCDERIDNLKTQIKTIDEKITELENRQNELINEAKKRDDVLRKYDIIRDDIQESKTLSEKSSLTLKKNDMADTEITELYEYYDKEESYTRYLINDLQFKLDSADKELRMIDQQFEQVKKRIFIFLCVYVSAIIIQGVIPGILGSLAGGVCLIVGLIAVFAIERASRGPILRYLIEQESPLVSEYCFRNDVTPVKYRRQEIVTMLKHYEEKLNDIKKRKQSLDDNSFIA